MQNKIRIRKSISKTNYYLIVTLSFVLILAVWIILDEFKLVNTMFLPTPLEVVERFLESIGNGSLLSDTYISVYRIVMGFLLATVFAIPIGILCACYTPLAAFFKPVCEFVRYMPVPAFVPLLMVWSGIGELSKILIIFIGTYFQMVLMVIDNADAVPDDLLASGYTLGANNRKAIFTILIPGMAPGLMQTCRMMIGWAWTYLVVAELVAANSGLGYSILKSQRFLKTGNIFMGILVIGMLGLFTDCIFDIIIKKAFPWAEGSEK
jgi:NitT/TauT family transport system permease protein